MKELKLPKLGSKRLQALLFIGEHSDGILPSQHPELRSALYGSKKSPGILKKYCVRHGPRYFLGTPAYNLIMKEPLLAGKYYHRTTDYSILEPIKARDLSVANVEQLPRMPDPLLSEFHKLKQLRAEIPILETRRSEIESRLVEIRAKIKRQENKLRDLLGV